MTTVEEIAALRGPDKLACAMAETLCARAAEDPSVAVHMEKFGELTRSAKTYERIRGFTLLCACAGQDDARRLDEWLGDMAKCLCDEKPIAVRKCLQALTLAIKARPDLAQTFQAALDAVCPERYADSMSPLIRKDKTAAIKALHAM